ncbi:MAG TPA: membrane dipeptidase [Spirochaetota bacterium]|nr:membrane dipeptidase [Spirochaetota bacterium]HPV43520.1 membrane dipeptidase [Spirochaetota bacterium]
MKRLSSIAPVLCLVAITGIFFSSVPNHAGSGRVHGFADIHLHQMAEYAFAGAWFYGSHKGPESVALKKCSGGDIMGGDHARTRFGVLNEFLGMVSGTDGDTGWHFYKRNGYPSYTGWPRWNTIAHQQVWEGHLRQAHESGLSLYVMSAVDFNQLCNCMPKKNMKPGLKCDEMSSVDVQLQAAMDFAAGRDWVKIARSPEEARSIINSGKLAMILAIEVTSLFNNDDWHERLDYYYRRYHVRSIQFAHQLDNRFTGVAPHHFIFKLFKILEDIGEGDPTPGFTLDASGRNRLGMTDEGKELARAMMEKHMIIDISHMSERAVCDLYEIAKEMDYYPLVLSHGHLRSIMTDKKQKEEKTTPDYIIRMIRETGGMIGLRTGSEQVKTYGASGVPNNCDGSTKSFAQAYQYGTLGLKVDIAFASDFNGFIQQLRPRFGGQYETCGASGNTTTVNRQRKLQTGRVGTPLDYQGFGHIGLEGDIIRELNNFGVDTTNLENSAEAFIRVWERCYDKDRTGPLDTSDMDTGGITE